MRIGEKSHAKNAQFKIKSNSAWVKVRERGEGGCESGWIVAGKDNIWLMIKSGTKRRRMPSNKIENIEQRIGHWWAMHKDTYVRLWHVFKKYGVDLLEFLKLQILLLFVIVGTHYGNEDACTD